MRSLIRLFAIWAAGTIPAMAAQQTEAQREVDRAGTVLKYAIPASALLATFLVDSQADTRESPLGRGILSMTGEPRHDLALAVGRAWVVTAALKHTVNERRPDGGNHSFPSGHTSMAFSGAEFIRKEYGWQWATPAYLAAGFVGWSRVKADRHFTGDVLAGAAIGILANHDFWKSRTASTQLQLAPAMLMSGRRLLPGIQFQMRH